MVGVIKYRLLFTFQKNFPQLTLPGRVYAYLRLRAADRRQRPREGEYRVRIADRKRTLVRKGLRFRAERPRGLQSEGK
jgi:hypothetical protein